MAQATKGKQSIINHIAMVLDMSGSMQGREKDLINVVDSQIRHLALRSLELDQETRVTVYTFDYNYAIECVFYDKDVLRTPSVKDHYKPRGYTALRDATGKALEDLAKTPELYGDHAFLTLVFTDGAENDSKKYTAAGLQSKLNGLAENWTVAVLVPNEQFKKDANRYGFPMDNIAVWSTESALGGMVEVGDTIRAATDTFMTGRSSGIRGTKSLFTMGAEVVNAAAIKQAGLKPLMKGSFGLVPVPPQYNEAQIRDFVTACGYKFMVGETFYQLIKSEKIQGNKALAIIHTKTHEVFMGDAVRGMVGLPDYQITVRPGMNPDYDIYVQSSSLNRKMVVGQYMLMLGKKA